MMTREELIAKAAEDLEFREQLKADPRATVGRENGITVPDDVEVTVVEETPKHAYIVLPVRPSELSPEELDAVAGGKVITNWFCDPTWNPS
jgi:hypothetical protein